MIIQAQVWQPLMKLVGREDLADHLDYATPEARLPHLDECFKIVEEWTQQRTKYEAMKLLNEVNIPCGPILDMKELLEDESLAAQGIIVEIEHPERGTFKTIGCPLKLSDSPVKVKTSPRLGEHTEEILRELVGYGDKDVEAARAEGAI